MVLVISDEDQIQLIQLMEESKSTKKPNMMKSYIQLQFNKTQKLSPVEEKEQEREVILEQNLDKGTRLSRYHQPVSTFQTIFQAGNLYTKSEKDGGLFGCFFCASRKTDRVTLENKVLSIRTGSDRLLSCLNFDTCTVSLKTDKGKIHILVKADDKSKEKTFYLEAPPKEDINIWETLLSQAIQESTGNKHELRYLSSLPHYWETKGVSEKEFRRRCNSGDLILFRSTHGFAKLQRGVTGSDYDHIALVLRLEDDEIVLFESNSDTGVALSHWKDIVRFKWYEGAERIVYRELKVERSQKFMGVIEDFVKYNLEKKFQINLNKLMTFTSKAPPSKKLEFENTREEIDRYHEEMEKEYKDRTYFCSQLIAKCYKALGLLVTNKSSTQYWPVNFTEARSLDLSGATLGPEEIICFDKQLRTQR